MFTDSPPHRLRTPAYLLALALANAGGVIAYQPLLTLLLPLKVEQIAGTTRIGLFSATVIAGAIAASVSNVLFGWLSDRALARGTGRRSWVIAGLVLTAASFGAVAAAQTPWAIIAAVALFQLAVNALLAPLLAIMADEVPDAQKGEAAGLLAAAVPLAAAVSAALVGLREVGEGGRLAIVAAVVGTCVVPLMLTRPQMAAAAVPAADSTPVERGDLIAAWAGRLLVQAAGNALSLYLLYYFESIVRGVDPAVLAPRVGHLLTIAYVLSLPIALVAGRLSDRVARRKPVLLGGASLSAAGLAGMAMAPDWRWAASAFIAYAIGSAVFQALHAAFSMQLLPHPAHRGRDLGLFNLANTLPALLGPLLAWTLATPSDFSAVLLVLAALTLAGGAAMMLVRSRR